ncbi:uncharacterized protein LOC107364984 [Tetranychus urticae]|nr:uncharacterized protein LOC107364984 [Tetranychus urticae]
MIDLDNKVALITGASDGIGAATALLFSSLGAKVAIVGLEQDDLDKVASECEANSPHNYKPVTIKADFMNDDDIKRTFEETINAYSRLDILVNNAGVINKKRFGDSDIVVDYDRVMQVNIRTAIILTDLAKPYLIESKGAIVNISSVNSFKATDVHWAYCISKAAVNMFTQAMASLLAPDVRVNAIAPGPVKTGIIKSMGDPDKIWDALAQKMALKRVAEPIEMARLVALLASDAAKNMTGTIITSDSGYLLGDPYR